MANWWINGNILSDSNEENIAEKPTTKRQPRKAFSIDFSVPLADVFVKVKVRLYYRSLLSDFNSLFLQQDHKQKTE